MPYDLTIVGCIGEITLTQREKTLKIEILNCINAEYELLLTFENTCKIFYCKFDTRNVLLTKEPLQGDASNQNCINETTLKVLVWKTLCLPFDVKDLILSNKNLWAVGQDYLINIKQHIENAVKSEKSNKNVNLEEDFMDIDADEEFSLQDFESQINIPSINQHKLQRNTFCIKCNLADESIVTFTKNLKTKSWQINITKHCINSSDTKSIPLPDLPLAYDESAPKFDSGLKDMENNSKPVMTFIHRREFSQRGSDKCKNNILHKLLSIDPASSNCICLIGHLEGHILYVLCSKSVHSDNFKVNSQMDKLCNIKQPIVGIHFIEEIKGIEGSGFILIVGSLGKLVFLSAEKFLPNSEVIQTKTVLIHAASLNLPTSIHKHIVYQDCIFYSSNNGDLWFSKLSSQAENKVQNKVDLSPSVLMHGVADVVLLNNLEGLLLVVTVSGYLYVCKCAEKEEPINTTTSLPSLMNEIMYQSTVLKNMAVIASYQHKFFAALSTFASLKYAGLKKCSISCSVTEINESFKKFLLSISFKCSEKLNSEFWFVTVSLYSHFSKNSALVSKTTPFTPDQSINLEVQESLLCQPHTVPFPIHVEVGLLLVLPENYRTMSCFKLMSKELPMYLRIQTLILNELYFMKHKASNSQNQSSLALENSKSVLSNIHKMSMGKPISKLFQIEQDFLSSHHQSFTLCLLTSSAQGIVKSNSSGSLLANEVFHLLLKRSHLQSGSEDGRLMCRNEPVNLNVFVSANENTVCVTVNADSFLLLTGIRMAIMELLLQEQGNSKAQLSQYVEIPAAINKKCEKLSKDLLCLLSEDSIQADFSEKIMFLYNNLRKDISSALPFS